MLNIFSYACWPSFSSCGRAVLSMTFGFRNGGEFCPLHLLAVRSRNQAGHFNLCTQVLCLQSSVQFSSVVQSCPTLCDPMDCSTPGLPVHHQFLELTWTHIHTRLLESPSVQFSHSFVSDSLQPHEVQHARPPCPSLTPEFTQTHVHWVGDAIQPSHPLSSPSPPAPNPSQHQSLFQWVSSSHEVAKVLEFQL